jgi:predicted thioredoxin/glutaredoxin
MAIAATYLRKDIVLENEVRFVGKVASAIGVVGAVYRLLLQSGDRELNLVVREQCAVSDSKQYMGAAKRNRKANST